MSPELRTLFDREFDGMVALARVVSNDPGEVEDIVMDAFLETGRRFDALTNPAGYLRTSVVNGARSRYRNSTTRTRIRTLHASSIAHADVPDVHENYLDDILLSLREAERTAIVLIYFWGSTHAEVAEVMGCPLGTVKSHVHRALRRLRQQVIQ